MWGNCYGGGGSGGVDGDELIARKMVVVMQEHCGTMVELGLMKMTSYAWVWWKWQQRHGNNGDVIKAINMVEEEAENCENNIFSSYVVP